jgi:murein DD-endopeptidase MepM/ murein hydrolase activator NlpD
MRTPIKPPESRAGQCPQPSGPMGNSPQQSFSNSHHVRPIGQPARMFEFLAPSAVPVLVSLAAVMGAPSEGSRGPWAWPIGGTRDGTRVILQVFEPHSTYGPGHRGIDLAAASGGAIRAMAEGTVTFAGMVAGRPVISISHERLGITSSMEPVAAIVPVGERVIRGQVIGLLTEGDHCPVSCLHVGMRRGERYLNPLALLRGFPSLKPTVAQHHPHSRPF